MTREMKKDSPEYKCFVAMWNFWKENGNPEDADEYWDKVIEKGSNEFALKPEFKECWDLSIELYKAIMNVLDYRHQSLKKYGDISHSYDLMVEAKKRQ